MLLTTACFCFVPDISCRLCGSSATAIGFHKAGVDINIQFDIEVNYLISTFERHVKEAQIKRSLIQLVKVILLNFKFLMIVADNLHLREKFRFSLNETSSHKTSSKICSSQHLAYHQGEKMYLQFKFLHNIIENTFHLILLIVSQ